MKKTTAGFVGGLIGGTIKLIIDQVLFVSGASPVNAPSMFSNLFLGTGNSLTLFGSIIYILGAAAVGWIISLVFNNKLIFKYFSSGLIIGASLWVIMNIVFTASGIAAPTWSMGGAGIISDLITHFILGIIISYYISKSNVEVID